MCVNDMVEGFFFSINQHHFSYVNVIFSNANKTVCEYIWRSCVDMMDGIKEKNEQLEEKVVSKIVSCYDIRQ